MSPGVFETPRTNIGLEDNPKFLMKLFIYFYVEAF